MPVYSFQLSQALAGNSVSVRAVGSADVVASGTLDADAAFTASLPVGDYEATAAGGHYSYGAAGTVVRGDVDGVLTEGTADTAMATILANPASQSSTTLAAAFETRLFTPAVSFTTIPGHVSGQTRYNGVSYNQDSVVTVNGSQFAVWYNEAGALIIGKRAVDSRTWATFDLSTVAGNPLALPVDTDSHNNASIGVDASGRLHVAANMHGDVLRYVRSTNPYDITAWSAPGMVGTEETQVTYPRFATHPDGTLFVMYRDGASGNGDLYLNRYTGSAWVRVGMVAQGKPTNENPYESRFAISRNGTLAVAITWRPNGGDHNTNADVHYIQSTDKGATWQTVTGAAVTLPLLHANTAALVLDTAATNSGIINQFGLDLDLDDRPHIALTLADGATPDRNVHHLYWGGSAWVNQQVTNLGNGMGYNEMPTRPAVACTNDGRTLILTSFPRLLNGRQGSFRLIDVTDGAATDVPVACLDGRDFEVTFDTHALRDRNELSFMVSAANGEVSSPGPEYWALNNWDRQFAGIVTVDLAQVGAVLRGEANLPRIRTVATLNVPNNAAVTATSDVIVAGSGGILTTPELRGKAVYARLTARASTTGGTLTLSVFEVQQGGTSRLFGSIPFTATSTVIRATPWMPLRYGPVGGIDAMLQVLARVTSTFTGTVSSAVLELGVIDA